MMEGRSVETAAVQRSAQRLRLPRPTLPLAGIAALALQACASVTVVAGDGTVSTVRSFGFLNVTPKPGTTPMVLRSTSLGLQSGPLGHSLGFARTSLTLLPADCRVVVTLDDGAASPDGAWRDLLRGNPCVTPARPQEEE